MSETSSPVWAIVIDFLPGILRSWAVMESSQRCLISFIALWFTFQLAFAENSPKCCEDLGFTGLALCSDCDSLAEYVRDEELVSDCRRCCAQEAEDSITKVIYAGAILEVCMRKLVFYPNVHSFIEDSLQQYSSLKVQYHYGSPPKLIMLDEDGDNKESIRIDNWKKKQIEDFLKEKVKSKSAR